MSNSRGVGYLRAAAAETDCAANLVRQEEESVEEARSGQPNALFPAAHVQLHQLAQDQRAEATQETMARQVLRWSLMAARPHPSPSMREVQEEEPGQRHPPSSSAVSPLAAVSTTVPGPLRTVVPRLHEGQRAGVAFARR